MKNRIQWTCILCHLLMAAVIIAMFVPGEKTVKGPVPMLVAVLCIEAMYLIRVVRHHQELRSASDLMLFVWAFMLAWEILVTKCDLMHPVLVPAPENVFYVFADRPGEILKGIWASLRLLIGGIVIGVTAGMCAGLVCAWITRLRDVCYPIARVLAPIPSIVFAPYVIAIMPSFRSASYVVIMLGIFWPQFLNTIIRVDGMDKGILDSARTLQLGSFEMILHVLLPYIYPQVIRSLKITLTTGVMMLTFAEMMGATSGMGYFIVNYNTYGNYTCVVAGIIVVGIVVTVLNKLATVMETYLLRWDA